MDPSESRVTRVRKWPRKLSVDPTRKPQAKEIVSSPPRSPIKIQKQVPQTQAVPPGAERSIPEEPSNMIIVSGNNHKIAMFFPLTSDSTPSLYAEPVPWGPEETQEEVLGWRPQGQEIEGWTETNDFQQAMEQRQWNPMGSKYEPPANQVPPDPVTGMPRNPIGRTGVPGKGLLPSWGPNPALIFVVTKYVNPSEYGHWELQVGVFQLPITRQMPWLLVHHPQACDGTECEKSLVDLWVSTRLKECLDKHPEQTEVYKKAYEVYEQAYYSVVYRGYLKDMVNTDNAWIEPAVINIHLGNEPEDSDKALELFAPDGLELRWVRVYDPEPMRSSHKEALNLTVRNFEAT